MLAFHSDRYPLLLPQGHGFPAPKYRLLRERAEASMPGLRLREADAASDGELALAHEPAWIEAITHGTTSAAQQREIGFPWSEALVQRARRSVGATIGAARAALFAAEQVAVQLAGGTHHAHADRGSGYCVFNDVAVAARLMQAEWHRERRARDGGLQVWVIDLDVHQGNGTASIFCADPTVFTFSMHGARNFPFRKTAGDLDVELSDGCADEPYLTALDEALATCWRRQSDRPPRLAFYLSGADAHEGDRLGRLRLSEAGLAERDRRVLAFLAAREIPVAVCMAGGYGRDIDVTLRIHLNTLAAAHASWAARQRVAASPGRTAAAAS